MADYVPPNPVPQVDDRQWVEDVYQLQDGDAAIGGEASPFNLPIAQNTRRSSYLRDRIDATDLAANEHFTAEDPHGAKAYADGLIAALLAGVSHSAGYTDGTLLDGLQWRIGQIPVQAAGAFSPTYAFPDPFDHDVLLVIPVVYYDPAYPPSTTVSLSWHGANAASYQVHNPSPTSVGGWYIAIGY